MFIPENGHFMSLPSENIPIAGENYKSWRNRKKTILKQYANCNVHPPVRSSLPDRSKSYKNKQA